MFDARILAVVAIELNRGFERADPFDVWTFIVDHYGGDLDLSTIRPAQEEVITELEAVAMN